MNNSPDRLKQQLFPISPEKFTQGFPTGSLRRIPLTQVPVHVKNYLEVEILGWLRAHDKPITSFVVDSQDKFGKPVRSYLIPCSEQGRKSSCSVYVIDTVDGRLAGWSRLLYDPVDVVGDTGGRPTSVRNETFGALREDGNRGTDYTNRGLGTDRLRKMAAFSYASWGEALCEDMAQDHKRNDARMWEHLVENGEAHYEDAMPFEPRAVFNTPKDTIKS